MTIADPFEGKMASLTGELRKYLFKAMKWKIKSKKEWMELALIFKRWES
jgi:hypothetical protein